jgi:hypothetical protein
MILNSMRKFLLFFAFCALNAMAQTSEPNLKWGKPTDEELNMTEYADDKEARAVVLCHLTSVNYTIDLYNYLVDYQVKKRIKILKDEGKSYANISIPYINNTKEEYGIESIESFKATAYNVVNGKVVKTKIGKNQIHTERIDEDYMLAKVAIPQAMAGTVIEYEYTLHSNVFFHIYDWDAQEEIPVMFAQYRLEIPALFIFNVETSGIQLLKSFQSTGTLTYNTSSDNMSRPSSCKTNIYLCTGRNLPALKKDDYVWNERDYITKVTAELKSYASSGGSYREVKKTWEQADNILMQHPEFGSRLNDHSKFRDELATAGIAGMTDLKEKVAATFRILRQKLAWNGEYELLAHPASEVIKKGSGTSGDLNMMLINMLGDVGIQAYPVVMSTRRHGRLPQTYPSLNKLNTFIVAVPNGTSWLYLDASSAEGYINVLSSNLYVERARLIQKGKPSQWVNLQNIGDARSLITVVGSISPEGKMSGEQTASYSGNAAANERRAFHAVSDSAAFITKKATDYGIEINSCQMTGHREYAENVKEVIKFTKQGEVASDHIYINPFTEFPIRNNPFMEAERLLPVEFPYKQTFSMTIRLALPKGWTLEEKPKSTRITTADKSISGHFLYEETDEHQLSIQIQFRLSSVTYYKSQYETLRQLFDLFSNRSKDMLVLKKI